MTLFSGSGLNGWENDEPETEIGKSQDAKLGKMLSAIC